MPKAPEQSDAHGLCPTSALGHECGHGDQVIDVEGVSKSNEEPKSEAYGAFVGHQGPTLSTVLVKVHGESESRAPEGTGVVA